MTDRLEARDAELAKMWAIMSEEVVELKEENAEMRKDVRTLQSLAFQHEEDFYEFLALPPWNNTAVACARRRRSPVGDGELLTPFLSVSVLILSLLMFSSRAVRGDGNLKPTVATGRSSP